MTFQEALTETSRRPNLVARPVGSTLRAGLGWYLDGGRVRWCDPTLLQDARQLATAVAPQPSKEELAGPWEVTYARR